MIFSTCVTISAFILGRIIIIIQLMKKALFLLMLLISPLCACTDIEINRGAELKQANIDRITPESNKGDVINVLGSPSSKSSFGDETWYYISNRRAQNIIGSDKVLEQDILAVTFDKNDKVSNVTVYNKDNMQNVQISDRKTPTAGHELNVLEQILGNVGKFNKDGDASTGRTSSRVPGG